MGPSSEREKQICNPLKAFDLQIKYREIPVRTTVNYQLYVPHISMMIKVRLVFLPQVQIKKMSPTKVQIAWFLMVHLMVYHTSRNGKVISVIHLPLSNFITNLQAKLVGKNVKRNALNHLIAWHIRLETANAFFLTNVIILMKKLNFLV